MAPRSSQSLFSGLGYNDFNVRYFTTITATAQDAAGGTATSDPVTVTVDNSGNPAVVGSWSSVVSLPTVAVNLILLNNNKILFYEDGSSPTIWDYTNNAFTNISTNEESVLFGTRGPF